MADVYDYNNPYRPAPPKKGWGCCTCGCITFVVLLVTFACLVFGGVYLVGSWLESAATGKDTEAYEGSQDEKDELQKKFAAIQSAVKNSQEATTTFTMQEVNMIIAMSPENMNLKHHLYITSSGNIMHAQGAFPIKLLISWAGDGDVPVDMDFVPEVVDGKVNIDIKAVKIATITLDPTNLAVANKTINDSLRQNLAKDPKVTESLSHVESLKMQDDEVVLTVH